MRPRTAPGSRFVGHSSRAAQSPSQQSRSRSTFPVLPVWVLPALPPASAALPLLCPEAGVALKETSVPPIAILDLAG